MHRRRASFRHISTTSPLEKPCLAIGSPGSSHETSSNLENKAFKTTDLGGHRFKMVRKKPSGLRNRLRALENRKFWSEPRGQGAQTQHQEVGVNHEVMPREALELK